MINKKKILAMFLLFTILFSHSAVVTQAIAATSFISIFARTAEETKNIEFQASFVSGEESGEVIASDVNNQELAIKLNLDVLDKGYLKDAKIEMISEDGKKPNFIISENNIIEEVAEVQSIENNVIWLNKIESSSEKIEIFVPVEYEMEEYINEEKLCATSKMSLSGIYVDSEGVENEILQELPLTLAWKDMRELRVENEVSKYVQFGEDGVLLQTLVKVDSSNPDKNSLPVKETELSVDVPKINDIAPNEITVIANSTAGTNGKGVGEVEFNENNWEYNEDKNTVNIKIENSKELVEINKSEEFLKVENAEVEKEERFYSVAGIDEFLISYVFKGVELADKLETSSKVNAKLTTFSGVQNEEMKNIVTAESIENIVLEGQTGNIVSYNIENETKEISKSYAYLNKETEFNSKTAINISYKDIVEEVIVEDLDNYYIDKSENKIATNDIYYKQISISKANFNEILGEEGKIEISDVSGNVLFVIDKEVQADEEGNYVIDFKDKLSKVMIKTSAPVNTGNLVLSNKKIVSSVELSKSDYANMEYLATDTIQKAKLEYVSEAIELGNCITKTKLNDTVTDFNLVLDRTSFTTTTLNSNVELKLEFNNDEITSDLYGASVFEIVMPQEVTKIDVTNYNMINGEGLELAGVETYQKDGKTIIKLNVVGKQENYNSSVLTNGTNIVLNADITVYNYATSKPETIKVYCYNSEATNYKNLVEYTINDVLMTGCQEAAINYSAPNGVIAVNTIKNYDAEGTVLTSIKQGEKIDYLDIFSEAKNATMEIVLLNNTENQVSDLAILGRVPFAGAKDIESGEELSTTVNTKMLTGIVATEANTGFAVYYSENGVATKDLLDESNGWTLTPVNMENVKSYLIVPNDENYKMEPRQILKFEYSYQIPENLAHNEKVYGTFLAYYVANTAVGDMAKTARPDLVGLTTGVGPELEIQTKSNVTEVNVLDDIEIITKVKNIGEDFARDIIVKVPVPENTTFVRAETNRDNATEMFDGSNVVVNLKELAKDAELQITVILKTKNIGKYGDNKINISSVVTAKDLQKEISTSIEEITIKRPELRITQGIATEFAPSHLYKKDDELTINVSVSNLTDAIKKDVVITTKLPKEIELIRAYMNIGEQEKDAAYNKEEHTVTWKVDELEVNRTKILKLKVKIGDLREGITGDTVVISTKVSDVNTETYSAEDIIVNVGKSSLSIVQTSETPTYVKEGDIIRYTFSIKNEGAAIASDVLLTNIVPEGIVVRKLSYKVPGENRENVLKVSETEEATISIAIPAKSQIDVNVEALALSLNGIQEKSVTNGGILKVNDIDEVKSNFVTHIIQAKEKNTLTEENVSENNGIIPTEQEGTTNQDITKTYKITGTAWLDSNANGMRDDNEGKIGGIEALLVESSTGVIKQSTTTNNNGEYTFAGVQNGSYVVLFKYDTVSYTTTDYRKSGVESNLNSDVVTTKIQQDGKSSNAAVTELININGANASNIDMGLIKAQQFSLALDKSITKVTVQNSKETKTEHFDKTKLAKQDIAAKYLAGTTVYVEYTLTVTNNGDLPGFASEIVDYIPEGMIFNDNLNKKWQLGNDGNLYTNALENVELAKGESKEIKLVLVKQMTESNTDIVSNTAEISADYNVYGVSDFNSKTKNKAQGEDDMNSADIILTVKTGESLIYISAAIISTLIGCFVAFIVYKKVMKIKRKGGA